MALILGEYVLCVCACVCVSVCVLFLWIPIKCSSALAQSCCVWIIFLVVSEECVCICMWVAEMFVRGSPVCG